MSDDMRGAPSRYDVPPKVPYSGTASIANLVNRMGTGGARGLSPRAYLLLAATIRETIALRHVVVACRQTPEGLVPVPTGEGGVVLGWAPDSEKILADALEGVLAPILRGDVGPETIEALARIGGPAFAVYDTTPPGPGPRGHPPGGTDTGAD